MTREDILMSEQSDEAVAEGERVLGQAQLPAVMISNARVVHEGFWEKIAKVAGRIPFAEDVVAAWYAMNDKATPLRTRALLLAALAYFVSPVDLFPDILVGLGFTDDATVLAMALALVGSAIKPLHREKAQKTLRKEIEPEPIDVTAD
jgi:uncharacterized membrane protein YkvA (DUF1232 family)